eukprot:14077669-Ditylum_brightwellii.AAC.2
MTEQQNGLLPIDKFSRTILDHTNLLNSHVWRCPAYALDPTLQDGKKLPKWNQCKRHGQFLDWSKHHASSVALICNLQTRSISPQFHTVMDDWVTTIARVNTDKDFLAPDNW